MSMNCGLGESIGAVFDAVHREMKQIHDIGVTIPVYPINMSRGNHSTALKYLTFLKKNAMAPSRDEDALIIGHIEPI